MVSSPEQTLSVRQLIPRPREFGAWGEVKQYLTLSCWHWLSAAPLVWGKIIAASQPHWPFVRPLPFLRNLTHNYTSK